METIKTVLVSAVIAALVAGGLFVALPKDSTGKPTLGALSSPDVASPYFSFGGLREWAATTDLRSASTTCAIQSPSATTTLVVATLRLDSVPTGATTWEIGNATTAFATTTRLAIKDIASGAQGDVIATTSATALTDGRVAPNTYINFKVATGTATYSGWTPTGRCSAKFREI